MPRTNSPFAKWMAVALLVISAAGCNQSSETPGNAGGSGSADSAQIKYPIKAIATIGMVADLVRHVGGDHVEVTQMLGPGIDPHLYKPTTDDVKAIVGSNIVFYSGLMLEGKMADTFVKVARTRPVIPVTEGLPEETLMMPDEFEGHVDPHVWNDVSAWSQCVTVICDALKEYDPDHAADYEAGAEAYKKELAALHEYGVQALAKVPDGSRMLITSHDAFNYFGRAYKLDVEGVQGLSTESEAGLQRINELVDMLVQRKVKAVFVESSVPRKNIEALVEGAKAHGHDVVIGGELFSDAMGEADSYEGTYVGMLDHNITLVARALGGEAPEKGLNGKLSVEAAE